MTFKRGDLVKGQAVQPRAGTFEILTGAYADGQCTPGKAWIMWKGMHRLVWASSLTLVAGRDEVQEPTTVRAKVLDEAKRITATDRNSSYGEPEDNFQRIADFWNVFLQDKLKDGAKITAGDTAALVIMVKLAREMNAPKEDNKVDIAGYAACWAEVDAKTKE